MRDQKEIDQDLSQRLDAAHLYAAEQMRSCEDYRRKGGSLDLIAARRREIQKHYAHVCEDARLFHHAFSHLCRFAMMLPVIAEGIANDICGKQKLPN